MFSFLLPPAPNCQNSKTIHYLKLNHYLSFLTKCDVVCVGILDFTLPYASISMLRSNIYSPRKACKHVILYLQCCMNGKKYIVIT